MRVVQSGFGRADTVYAFNSAAKEIFEAARQLAITTVLDQTSAPRRWNQELLIEESHRWPGWEKHPVEIDIGGRLIDREEAEWELADIIVCGSHFVAEKLAAAVGSDRNCHVVHYPLPTSGSTRISPRPHGSRQGAAFRILFVGTLQLRKGIQYLLGARRRLGATGFDIRLVGPNRLSRQILHDLDRVMDVYGPVPRPNVATHYDWADVLVLPTLSEGSANVCHEAMAAGLPVITTPNAGSVVRDGVDGFIVPIRDPEAIADRIERLAGDLELAREISCNAIRQSEQWGLQDYAHRLAEIVSAVDLTARPAT